MKKAEIRKIIFEYISLKSKNEKNILRKKINEDRIKVLAHKYFHETGQSIESCHEIKNHTKNV